MRLNLTRRKAVLLGGLLILSVLTMGCSLCTMVRGLGKNAALTAVATVQTQIAEREQRATPTPAKAGTTPSVTQTVQLTPGKTVQPTATKGSSVVPTPTGAAGIQYQPFDDLSSYRYTIDIEMIEQSVKTTVKTIGAFVREPPASQLEAETQQGDESPQAVKLIRVEDVIYLYDAGQEGWIAMDYDASTVSDVDLMGLLTGELGDMLQSEAFDLISAHENVADVACSHYRADARDLSAVLGDPSTTFTSGTVDVWTANSSHIIMRVSMNLTGVDSDNKAVEGKLELQVSDVDKPIQILPPPKDKIVQDLTSTAPETTPTPGVSAGIAKTLPKPADAAAVLGTLPAQAQALAQGQDIDFYRTNLSQQDAVKFFEEALPKQGWAKVQSMPTEQMTILVFSKGDNSASIVIMANPGGEGNLVVVAVQ